MIAWPRLHEAAADARTISPRALIVQGPVTRPAVIPPEAAAAVPAAAVAPVRVPLWAEHWRTGVCGALAAAAAVLVVIAAGAPDPVPQQSEPLASVGAASPPTATALQPKPPESLPSVPATAAVVAAPAPAHPIAEDVIYVEDESDPDATGASSRAARRARARDVARAATRQGRLATTLGDHRSAEIHYKDALAALPTYGPASVELATLYMQRGKYETALTYAKRASRSAPRKLAYRVLLGDAYRLVGRDRDARAQWQRAAEYGSAKAQRRLATTK